MTFDASRLLPPLVHAASAQGWHKPTPVQTQVMAPILDGRDVRACAQTGSGKTAGFLLPLLQRLMQVPAVHPDTATTANTPRTRRITRVLVLVPTRELAAQVGAVCNALATHLPARLKTAVIFGGVSINPQMLHLRGGADIVVATPGRLLDLLRHNALQLNGVESLVLDEADRLLDLGFAGELADIRRELSPKRQNLLFSATFRPAVQTLADDWQHDAVHVEAAVDPAQRPAITQRAICVDPHRRTPLLRHLLAKHGWDRALVFVATKYAAEQVADKLRRADINAEPFHGMLSQGKRNQVLADFKAQRIRVVVSTDLAGRGIDITQLPAVVNFDLPRAAADYIHRIGRTGRAGESGLAVSFVSAEEEAHFQLIEKRQGILVPREQIAGFEPTQIVPLAPMQAPTELGAPSSGGIKGRRPSKKDKLRAAALARDGDLS